MEQVQGRLERTPEDVIREIAETKAPAGCTAVWFFGQESVVLKGSATTVWVDPFLSDYLKAAYGVERAYPSFLNPEHVVPEVVDWVLITHEHEDHLDPWTMKAIASQCPEVKVMAPLSCRDRLVQECGFDPSQIVDANTESGGFTVTGRAGEELHILPIPAAHESLELLDDIPGNHRYVGYVIRMNGVVLYHAGDTIPYAGLVELLAKERIDLGFLPINGRDYFRNARGIVGNLDVREAAELAWLSGIDTVIPLHYDGIPGNGEEAGRFLQELQVRFPKQKSHVMICGERYVYAGGRAFR